MKFATKAPLRRYIVKKMRLFGMKELSKQPAPDGKTLPLNGKPIKTYFVSAEKLAGVWKKLAKRVRQKVGTVKKTYGLFCIDLPGEQLYRIPWYRREFVK